MMRAKRENRTLSFVLQSSNLCQDGKINDGMKMVNDGLRHYSNEIVRAISPYAVSDAGIIVAVLRHIADEMEVNNDGAKELATYLTEHFSGSVLKEKAGGRRASAG